MVCRFDLPRQDVCNRATEILAGILAVVVPRLPTRRYGAGRRDPDILGRCRARPACRHNHAPTAPPVLIKHALQNPHSLVRKIVTLDAHACATPGTGMSQCTSGGPASRPAAGDTGVQTPVGRPGACDHSQIARYRPCTAPRPGVPPPPPRETAQFEGAAWRAAAVMQTGGPLPAGSAGPGRGFGGRPLSEAHRGTAPSGSSGRGPCRR